MAKKVLVTGISGFAGSFLAEYLIAQSEYEVSGTYLSSASLKNLTNVEKKLHLDKIDLKDSQKTLHFIKEVKPDLIFHLAALPAVGASFDRPSETIVNNVTAEINVLESVRNMGLTTCRILIVSSADMYGRVSAKDLPIDEETGFYPTNTYAVSKIAQDYLGLQYFMSYNMQIIRARPFNHVGPRQTTGFVIADFAQKIAQMEKGKIEPILRVGNLNTKRDFTDVRDMARAYVLLLEKGKAGDVYNIGTGVSYTIADMLDMLLSYAKITIQVKEDPSLIRPQDSPDRVCNNKKLTALIDWEPIIPLKQTLEETLDYWRNIV